MDLFRRRDTMFVMGMCKMMIDDEWMDGWIQTFLQPNLLDKFF